MAREEEIRTVNLDLGNAAELHMVALNAAHIVSAKLTGSVNSGQRRMELQLSNGSVISMSFDEAEHAEKTFAEVINTINRTIPDHRA